MVTAALIVLVLAGVRAVVGLTPEWGPEDDPFEASAYNVGSTMAAIDGYFPVSTILVCLILLVSVKVFLLGFRFVTFIYHQFWGSS